MACLEASLDTTSSGCRRGREAHRPPAAAIDFPHPHPTIINVTLGMRLRNRSDVLAGHAEGRDTRCH